MQKFLATLSRFAQAALVQHIAAATHTHTPYHSTAKREMLQLISLIFHIWMRQLATLDFAMQCCTLLHAKVIAKICTFVATVLCYRFFIPKIYELFASCDCIVVWCSHDYWCCTMIWGQVCLLADSAAVVVVRYFSACQQHMLHAPQSVASRQYLRAKESVCALFCRRLHCTARPVATSHACLTTWLAGCLTGAH